MLELESAAREEISNLKTGHQGILHLGMVSSGGHEKLYGLLREFKSRYPHIQVKVHEGNSYELLEQLRKGKLDVSLLRSPFSLYGLDLVPLEKTSMAVGLSGKAFPSFQPGSFLLKDLTGLPLILYRRWEKSLWKNAKRKIPARCVLRGR